MQRRWIAAWIMVGLAAAAPSQTHRVTRPQTVVRAVGVYEWTGDIAKPAGSRLIPVTLYIDGELQDAGEYLARPVPLALDTGNVYELQQAGVAQGTLELSFARHLTASGSDSSAATPFDEGWFGYGAYHANPKAKKGVALAPSRHLPAIEVSGGSSGRPHFSQKDAGAKPGDSTATADADTAARNKEIAAENADRRAAELGKTPAGDAGDEGRPTLGQRGGSSPDTADPASDSDRPTLKKHSPADSKKAARAQDEAKVTGVGSLNDDPNRPSLHRGKPAGNLTADELPALRGVPADLHQMVAVSDATMREEHPFARAWPDEAERVSVLATLRAAAEKALANYGGSVAPVAAGAVRHPNSKARRGVTADTRRSAAAGRAATVPAAALSDEQVKGYTLSYGAPATFVYTAQAEAAGGVVKYVAVVAQGDGLGSTRIALSSVTDSGHLDRGPWMRLVDAVDVSASNRASLLFELRGQTSRQFGLYRVMGGKAVQTYLSGTTQ